MVKTKTRNNYLNELGIKTDINDDRKSVLNAEYFSIFLIAKDSEW